MNSKTKAGIFIAVSGMILLAAQLYCLPLVQAIQFAGPGHAYASVWSYAVRGPVGISFLLSLALVTVGAVLIVKGKNSD